MDEAVECAVEDGLRVADLVVCPMIFDQLVRVKHVRADLTPKADVLRCSSFTRGPSKDTLAAFSLAHVAPLRGLAASLPCIHRSSGIRQRTSLTGH